MRVSHTVAPRNSRKRKETQPSGPLGSSPSVLSRKAVSLSVCSTAGCHGFPLDTHWIVTLFQARSEVRTGQRRTQKARHVTTVPAVFAELHPGLRHGDKDDPTLPLPLALRLHSMGPSLPSPAQLILFWSLTLRSLPPESLSSSLPSAPALVFYTWT